MRIEVLKPDYPVMITIKLETQNDVKMYKALFNTVSVKEIEKLTNIEFDKVLHFIKVLDNLID